MQPGERADVPKGQLPTADSQWKRALILFIYGNILILILNINLLINVNILEYS